MRGVGSGPRSIAGDDRSWLGSRGSSPSPEQAPRPRPARGWEMDPREPEEEAVPPTMSQVVPIALSHVESFHRALDVVARERRFLAALEAPPLDDVRRFVEGNLAQGNPQFVALDEDRVVGWCDIVRHGQEVRRHCGTLGMGVLPECRGRGLGRSLLERSLAEARRNRFLRVELHVRASNSPAVALYQGCGFRTEGRLIDHICVDGRFDDTLSMAILLR